MNFSTRLYPPCFDGDHWNLMIISSASASSELSIISQIEDIGLNPALLNVSKANSEDTGSLNSWSYLFSDIRSELRGSCF